MLKVPPSPAEDHPQSWSHFYLMAGYHPHPPTGPLTPHLENCHPVHT